MRFLVLLVNLVPYHLARWGAVAQQGHEVTVLQRRTGDCFKVLETNPTAAPFAVHTLQEPGPSVPALRRQVALWIETVAPEVVVVSGYSFAESLAALTAAADRSLPVVLCSESNRHDGVRQPLGEWVKRRIVRHAQAALVGGADHAAYLQELGMDAAAIFRGYNAVDNRSLRQRQALAAAGEICPAGAGTAASLPAGCQPVHREEKSGGPHTRLWPLARPGHTGTGGGQPWAT
jgi:hypothetical protein